jgi:hypothetical protein
MTNIVVQSSRCVSESYKSKPTWANAANITRISNSRLHSVSPPMNQCLAPWKRHTIAISLIYRTYYTYTSFHPTQDSHLSPHQRAEPRSATARIRRCSSAQSQMGSRHCVTGTHGIPTSPSSCVTYDARHPRTTPSVNT